MKSLIAIFVSILFCIVQQNSQAQILGNPIYYWDFADSIPSGWTNSGQSALARFEYRGPNTTPSNAVCSRGSCGSGTLPPNSLTQSNGFMIFDSNYWDDNDNQCGGLGTGQDPAPHNAWMITNTLDFSGQTNVYITYQQQLRSYSASVKVYVSTNNGSTWTEITALTQSGIINSPNVQWKTANVSSWVANQSAVKFKFQFQGTYYHWCLDDIALYVPSYNNLELSLPQFTNYNELADPFVNPMYDVYPSFMPPLVFPNAHIANLGTYDQTNVVLNNKTINLTTATTIANNNTSPITLASGASINLNTNSVNIGPVTADYQVTYSVTQTEVDENPANNTDTLDFSIHPYRLQYDEGETDNLYNVRSLQTNTIAQTGTLYYLPSNNNKKIYSIEVCIGEGTLPGTQIQGYIYIPTMDSILAETVPYTINLADINAIGDERMITLPLVTPFTLSNANLTFPDIVIDSTTMETEPNPFQNVVAAMVRVLDNQAPFYIARSGKAAAGTTYLHYPSSTDLYYLLRIPMVRLKIFNSGATPGCTDPLAMNYSASYSTDDGSCDYPGCTQSQYDNYDPTANWDDGSCGYEGCMDPVADNYNPTATIMVPCEYWGCMDATASNFDPTANVDDGSCLFAGCTDSLANNYDPQANQNDGSCIYLGCTDNAAINFDPNANTDDGSCIIVGCTNSNADNYNPTANQDDGSCIISGCTNSNADNYDPTANLDDGSCYFLGCTDNNAFNYDSQATVDDGSCLYTGCTDTNADNFDPNADIDDGSCIYIGCTDSLADNFDPTANQDDGSCFYLGCMDPNADNYDPMATIDDNSCLYYGCTDNTALNYDAGANFNDGSCVYLQASLWAPSTNGCAPFTLNVTNQTVSFPESQCQFIISTGDTINGCVPNFSVLFEQPGSYSIIYNYYYDGFLSSYTMNINVYAKPAIPIITSNPNTGIISMTNGVPGTYAWYANNAMINPVVNAPTFNNLGPNGFYNGNFTLWVTNSNGCTSISSSVLVLQPNFSIADNTICQSDTASIAIVPINVAGVTCTINWGDGIITPSSVNTHQYALPGNYNITVECTKNGTTGQLTKPITIYALPSSPLITYTTGTLSIQNIEANTNYQWFEDGVAIPGQTTTQYNNFIGNQYNNGTFTILAYNGNSCSILSQPFVVVQPYFTTPVDSSCTSYSGMVFNQSEIINGMTCNWNLNNISTISTSQASINYDVAGWYNIELTCQLGSTSMSYADSIWITQSPAAPSLAYNALGNVSCTNFNATETHLWFQNGQWITGATNSNFSIFDGTQYVSGWYRMNAINNNGCLTQGDSIYVLQPEFNLSLAQACQGDVITMNTNNNIPDDYDCQVLWGDGQFDLFNQATTSIDHTYNMSGTVGLTLYCQNPYGYGYFTDQFDSYASPNIPLLATQIPNVACINCGSGLSYDWTYWSNGLSSNGPSTNIDLGNNYANGPYQLTVTNANGCNSTSDIFWSIIPVFTVSPTEACPNSPVTLTNNTDGMDWLQCQINWGDGFGDVISDVNTLHTYVSGYSGDVQVTCYYDVEQGENAQWINIHDVPTPVLEEINEIIYITNFEPGWQSQWTIDNVAQPLYNNLSNLSANLGNDYSVITTNSWGCSDSSSITTDYIAPHVDEWNLPLSVDLFPNPASDLIQINCNHTPATLEIWSAQGQLIRKMNITSEQTTLELFDFSNGLYNFTLRTTEQIFSAQFVVSR
jgi:hypothetical protein